MKTHYLTQGFIVQKINIGEADRIFKVYTEDFGLLSLWAISERKIESKLRGGLELWYLSSLEFIEGKNRKVIVDARSENNFSLLRNNAKQLAIANRIGEVATALLAEGHKEEGVWVLMQRVLEELNAKTLSIQECHLLYFYFLWS